MDNLIQQLGDLFTRFPGIGPRQAKRFVYYLLSTDEATRQRLAKGIVEIKAHIRQCDSCCRFFPTRGRETLLCDLCADTNRDEATLMLVEKDIDLDNIRRLGVYQGNYFILGGLIPILDKNPDQQIRLGKLKKKIEGVKENLKEVIIALAVNPEGDHTADYLKKELTPLAAKFGFKLTVLGRGLSTGTELEYSDADTLRHALKHRE